MQSQAGSSQRPRSERNGGRRPTRSLARVVVLMLLLGAAGCVSHRHSVGLGATGTGEKVSRQWYVLFGLIQANEVDAQRMANGLTSYEIETEYSFVDLLLGPLLLPLTVTTRTVKVRT